MDKVIDYAKDGDFLKALAHPVRLRMVEGILVHGCNVSKIVEKLRLPQSTVSQHLAILRQQGIVAAQKEGVKTCYRIADPRIKDLLTALKGKRT